ncbi:hypothetical protein EW026_g815 [Hermanssonia centrifuga]|uniref:AA9 family lytic polysaccharide monooxygenase n=1 Tax=Hermanssonia centrifuga TaxID=98765 RepID=A0A4S4KTI6_9APHY|nr:hypothetical protein EW026_g815 [Hermanssonia centrifuga]
MKFAIPFVVLVSAVKSVHSHTTVWSVWVNGVDQGSGVGIREPAYNDPPTNDSSSGYNNSPVRDLESIDMRCNVLGDIPDPNTIQVQPNDIVTFEWHHQDRTSDDDIIASSHHGAGLVYISPNPPTNSSWVKIQEEGEGPEQGTWYVTGKQTERQGKQDIQIPADLAPGQYFLRPELLALHEADVAHIDNPNRGIQIYVSCIQIEVVGNGTTTLPAGVGFPGAYLYTDPGIVFNIYEQTADSPLYPIPGPPVWSGAAPSPDAPAYGTTLGYTTAQQWSTWIGGGFVTATLATSLTIDAGTATITAAYTPYWPATYETPVPTTFPVSSLPVSAPTNTVAAGTPRTAPASAPTGVSFAKEKY